MKQNFNLVQRHIITFLVAIFATATIIASGKGQIYLGPAESGTWNGSEKWPNGAYGAASTSYDFNDVSHGACSFVISNTAAGKENNADWRCMPFSLGPAAGGARPITFSFAYKLPDLVAAGNNVRVSLRFWDSTGTNYLGGRDILLGAHTGDSAMTEYRTLTMSGIMAPPKARLADITMNANIFAPWVSGTARFDDFSVMTESLPLLFQAGIVLAILLGIGVLTLLPVYFWRRRAARARASASPQP
jgi:hypothetical protein